MSQDNTTAQPDDLLDQQWACMACNSKFRLGKMKVSAYSETRPWGHGCPNCGDGRQLHPADGQSVELGEYHGERGPLQ